MGELLICYTLITAKKNITVIRSYICKDQVETWKYAYYITEVKKRHILITTIKNLYANRE